MIARDAESYVAQLSVYFPVITITGPRQSGKTTLAGRCFPEHQYCSLEDPDTRSIAETDPRGFFRKYRSRVILDEVQRVPQILSYIQTMVDERKKKADFILTGSHQPLLVQTVSQSLAGRTGLLKLYPLSQKEIHQTQEEEDPFQFCFQGSYPALYSEPVPLDLFYPNYYQTYLERDVRQLVNIKNSRQFQVFIRLLAGRVGQLINFSALAADTGVSGNTIKEWMSILEASFIILPLQPYFKNIRKRLVKSPKLYFCDTGLLCYLLGIEELDQLTRDPLRGGIYENFIILDIIKGYYNQGKTPRISFLRDSKGFEVDLVIEQKGTTKLVEIKSSATWNKEFQKNLVTAKNLFPDPVECYVIYAGKEEMTLEEVKVLPGKNTASLL